VGSDHNSRSPDKHTAVIVHRIFGISAKPWSTSWCVISQNCL
jgi:hypothetical protein